MKRSMILFPLAASLALPGAAQEILLPDYGGRTPLRCGVVHDELPAGPPGVIEYQMVEAPAGSTTEIGVLFLYTDRFTASQVRSRVREWVRTANELFDAGTSGVQLKSVGVEPAPASVSRLDYGTDGSEQWWGILDEVMRLDSSLRRQRENTGADVVSVVNQTSCGGGIGWVWDNTIPARQMKLQSYSVVGMAVDSPEGCRWYEGFTLAHEVGHILGLTHDRKTIDDAAESDSNLLSADEVKPYLHDSAAFGYVNPGELFYTDGTSAGFAGTVMSYSDQFLRGFSRSRGDLPVFGATDLTLGAGDSTTNADRALRKTAATVAAFYTAGGSRPDPDPPPSTPDPDPPPSTPDPGPSPPPTSGQCTLADGTVFDCHTTAAGHFYGVRYFHEGEWKWADIGVRSGDSAVFHFFGPDNLEVFAKVLNGCAIDGTFWVYGSGLTDLPIGLHVWPAGGGTSAPFQIPDGTVLRPNNGGRLNWCGASRGAAANTVRPLRLGRTSVRTGR